MHLPYICNGKSGPIELRLTITRDTLEALTVDLVDRTFTLVQKLLDAAHMSSAQLDDVILVGGQTRSPLVRRRLHERFARRPSTSVHPDEAVGLGAALIANALEKKREVALLDLLPASIRLVQPDGSTRALAPRGSRLPLSTEIEVAADPTSVEFKVTLCRGEGATAAENAPLGSARLPATQALVFTGQKARAKVALDPQGILSVCITHPITGETHEVALSLH
jgi:molecular chaperone DnaK